MLGRLVVVEDRRVRFDRLCAHHLRGLEAAARHLCRDPATAADLVQDTLERAWRRLESLHDDDRARAWLVRILRNAWLDQLRRRRTEVPIDEIAELAATGEAEPPRWDRLSLDDVKQAIESLEEPFRTVAILHDLDACSYDEIARRLGIPYATAATRLHRARKQLRAVLQRMLREELP